MFFKPSKILSLNSFVEAGVDGIEVLAVKLILGNSEGVGEPLVMHDLPLTQELDGIPHVGIIHQAENVIVGDASLLLCYYHVFATKLSLAKVRKILILQGFTALLV